MTIAFVVSVDTEEEFDWSEAGTSVHWSLRHLSGIPRFQDLCERYGVRPTYLIDFPIATSAEACEMLGRFQNRGACEIGAHIHPWINPPITEEITPRNTYLCNLPLSLQVEKLGALTETIQNAFGVAPTSFKAGRYGIDFALAPHLSKLGYTIDSSVIAYTDFSDDQGPDFSRYSSTPFWIGVHPNSGRASQTSVLEVPCTVGFNRRPARIWSKVHARLSHPRLRLLHPIGVLDRTKLLRKIVLSPELASSSALIALMRSLVRSGARLLNLTLHSPSLKAGNTPFVQTEDDLNRFYSALRSAFDFAVNRLNATCFTLSEYRQFVLRNQVL